MSTEEIFLEKKQSLEAIDLATTEKKQEISWVQRQENSCNEVAQQLTAIFADVTKDLNSIPTVRNKGLNFLPSLKSLFTGNRQYDNNEDGLGQMDYCRIGLVCTEESGESVLVTVFKAWERLDIELSCEMSLDKATRGNTLRPLRNEVDLNQLKRKLAQDAALHVHRLVS